MKIKTKFIVLGIIALILILISGETIRVSQVQKDEAYLINLAGRQRMLSQKMTKEFFQYQKQPTEASAAALMKTVKVFDQTLSAFIGGGSTSLTLDPDSAKRQQIAAISNPEQLAQLRRIQTLWADFSGAIDDFLENSSNAAAAFVTKNNMALLKESNNAVSIFQRHASEQSGRNQQMQIIATVLSLDSPVCQAEIKRLDQIAAKMKSTRVV
ncbi:MAG: type IV pili methyl-accepting chemotaxis transducer N-terminal domain-containing protein, partial [Opitutales bacterium]